MDGILNINKMVGCTSHDVVYKARKITGEKKIGHAGTLDPDASGVLILCLGKATRAVEYLSELRKSYRAVIRFGIQTDSEDASGNIVARADSSKIMKRNVEEVLPLFVGNIMQTPPMVSAVHHNGKRLYQLARAGIEVERAPRPVTIYSISLVDFVPGNEAHATVEVSCSRGTYIRTLCADIGRTVGCGAHMESLVRTSIGDFDIQSAVGLDDIADYLDNGGINGILISMNDALSFMPDITLSDDDAAKAANGMKIRLAPDLIASAMKSNSPMRIRDATGNLIAVGRLVVDDANNQIILKPDKVFSMQ